MRTKQLIILLLVAGLSLFCTRSLPADEETKNETVNETKNETKNETVNEDQKKVEITLFKSHNDFTETNTFKTKQTIILYVIWNIPESVELRGHAVITIEGKQVDGRDWLLKDKKDLRPGFASHYWGWDCQEKIPKKAMPGSTGTATVELNIDGIESIKKSITFFIEDN